MNKRKNFLPTFFVALLSWLIFVFLVIFTSPASSILLFTFYFLLFAALFLTSSLVLGNSRAGFLISLTIIVFLILRHLQIANFLNLGLLLASLVSVELYLKKR